MPRMSAPPESLANARYLSLETFRKDGTGVKTPVWFAALDGKLIVATEASTYKVKRLRNDPKVRVAACNGSGSRILGPWLDGSARLLDGDEARRGDEALSRKYTWQRKAFHWFAKVMGRIREPVVIEITLAAG